MSIGSNIKKIRKEKKLTQQQLAKEIGISRSYLSDVENNRYNPSSKTLESFAEKLDVSMYFLTTGTKTLSDTSMKLDVDKLAEDIKKFGIGKKTKKHHQQTYENLKDSLKKLLDSELSFFETMYLTNAINYLYSSSDDDINVISSLLSNLNRYKDVNLTNDVTQDDLLEFINDETEDFKDFLKKRYNYKEGD